MSLDQATLPGIKSELLRAAVSVPLLGIASRQPDEKTEPSHERSGEP
jgi:hypothetical protein